MPEACSPEPPASCVHDSARKRRAGPGATRPVSLRSLGRRSLGLRSLGLASLGLVLAAQASPPPAHFRWIGSDGTVNYGDSPPPDAGRIVSATSGTSARHVPPPSAALVAAPGGARLPFELRIAAQRHPVTLYTTSECPPCEQARVYLGQRGVPHDERSVQTGDDASAFRALGFGELSFPALRVGTDTLIGFESGGWNRALDGAGYPKTSHLPLNRQSAPAKPMAKAAVRAMAARFNGSEPTSQEEAASTTDRDDTASGLAATQASDPGTAEIRRLEGLSHQTSKIRF